MAIELIDFKFGEKVMFSSQSNVHPSQKDKEYCLLGFESEGFALVEWERRGQLGAISFHKGNPHIELTSLDEE